MHSPFRDYASHQLDSLPRPWLRLPPRVFVVVCMQSLLPLISRRWSPYAFCAKTRVEPEKLALCFEAARWAPSSYNQQPWHIIYADKYVDPAAHARVLSFMVDFNQSWAENAPVVGIVATRRESEISKQLNPHAGYDCGAAMAYLTMQATELGLHVHQMAGFDLERATNETVMPEGYSAITMFAMGYVADDAQFLSTLLQERNEKQKERVRKELDQVVSAAAFK